MCSFGPKLERDAREFDKAASLCNCLLIMLKSFAILNCVILRENDGYISREFREKYKSTCI